ncbi:MAG TPA: ABC transporter [Cyanothece sp. UBA12306]|nr:ABC transporter [Cyanothece sp. UBA12306]
MKLKFNYRIILKYLFIPGIILTVAGLVVGLTTKDWSILPLSLVIAGGILLVSWLLFLLITGRSFWNKRSTQAGTNALVSTISLITILGIINFIAVRYSSPIDLTENQLFTLSPQTQEIVKNLKNPLKVWIFIKDTNPIDKKLLENYRRYNQNFEFEFVDPDTNLGLTKKFNVESLGDVYLEYGDKRQLAQTLIAFNTPQPLSEIQLTNAIEKIQRDYTPTIYFLQGHGEYSLEKSQQETEGSISTAISNLENKGYKVEPLNLVETGIPDDADTIIIAGPKRKLFDQEVKELKTYSNQGGNLLVLLNPNTETGLETILEEWGVKLDNRIVIDGSSSLGPAIPLINSYGSHPITKEFSNGMSFYPLSRPIDTVKVDNVEATSLLVANDQMWAENDLESEELTFDPTQDIAGPFDLGVALVRQINPQEENQNQSSQSSSNTEEKKTENPTNSPLPDDKKDNKQSDAVNQKTTKLETNKNTESRIVVVGNSTFITDTLFNQQLNGDVFLNSVQWLANQDDQPLSIRPKEAKNRRINLTPLQGGILTWLTLVIFPLLGLAAASVTWWRRR